jgi:hypothetical protein
MKLAKRSDAENSSKKKQWSSKAFRQAKAGDEVYKRVLYPSMDPNGHRVRRLSAI